MPVLHFLCGCGATTRRLTRDTDAKTTRCDACGAEATRNRQAPGTSSRESLDNGIMPRRLERLSDAEELHRDRAKKH